MAANESYAGEWMVKEGKATVTGKTPEWQAFDAEVKLKMEMITAPYRFGFHCSELGPVVATTTKNDTDEEKNSTTVSLTLMGFQVFLSSRDI